MIARHEDSDRLRLNGLEIDCVIGDLDEERAREQRIVLDLVLTCGLRAAGASDDLRDTVDYAALAEAIRRRVRAARCRMIERAAELAAQVCLEDLRVSEVSVRVEKVGAVPGL
ncbi:MAG: dihydroneopterin aldolase, partial [Kiritimatiellae bacterium]|nr:dihydroneopterin aldolase [Kiritimatiellia bacterium]